METDILNREFHYYLDNQDELVKKYDGRILVIMGEKVVGDYENYDDAYFDSVKKYELGTFLLQECTEGEEAYTETFHSPIFA
jgi:hypothetical protein